MLADKGFSGHCPEGMTRMTPLTTVNRTSVYGSAPAGAAETFESPRSKIT